MKVKIIILVLFLLIINVLSAQSTSIKSEPKTTPLIKEEEQNFKLFPTRNMWTFIKLDTRNGKLWQVQFGFNEVDRSEVVLSSISLLSDGVAEKKGRYMLYPTENFYNFILLDQIDGSVYQVQWSLIANERGIYRIH